MVKTIVLIGIMLVLVLNFAEVVNILKTIYGVIFPLLLGAGIAYVLNIIVSGYEKIYFPKTHNRKIAGTRRGVCIALALLTIVLILLFFLRILIPQIGQTIYLFSAGFPVVYNNVMEWASQYADKIPVLKQKLTELNMDGTTVLKNGLGLVGNWAWGTASLMGTVFGQIVNFVLALFFSIYILFAKEELKGHFHKVLNAFMRKDRREKFYEGLRTANETFSNYFVGQFKEAVILGILCTIGMLIFRFPYATIIGPVIGLTALIPMIGAYIGATVGFLIIVMVDPVKAVLFLVFVLVLQQVEGNLIYPKVVGKSIGLPGIWVFAAVIIGAGLMGIAGVMLGVPIIATIYKLLGKSVNKRQNDLSPNK